jgi:hypothetical protein
VGRAFLLLRCHGLSLLSVSSSATYVVLLDNEIIGNRYLHYVVIDNDEFDIRTHQIGPLLSCDYVISDTCVKAVNSFLFTTLT